MFKRFRFLLCLFVLISIFSISLQAEDRVQPFVLASETDNSFDLVIQETNLNLKQAGFNIVGHYQPYDGAEVIVFTSDQLKAVSQKSERGGYGSVIRVSITQVKGSVEDKVEVAYTNPLYWANAYRLKENLDAVSASLKSSLGFIKSFGSGKKVLSAKNMRNYHYTFMMEYFDDPSDLNSFSNHQKAVQTIEKNLVKGKNGTSLVYKISLGKDIKGNEMTLFGVGLKGQSEDDCGSDSYIMSRIDKSTPRHTAHLPYELLVYGDEAEALYARFRIAISWPHLPMMQSETGATFMSIMCSPGAIEDVLESLTKN